MTLLQTLQASPAFLILFVGLVALMVGSFLNVVIHRLPIMMESAWRRECMEFLELPKEPEPKVSFNLMVPGSRCPHCDAPIRAHQNIPVISYLFLGGKCARCGGRISLRYPLLEATTAIASCLVAWRFGFSFETLFGLMLTWGLICLTMIDFDHQLLPDSITLPLLWLGLIISLFSVFTDSRSAIIGAAAGYLLLWTVYQLFKLMTGKEGMGFGDFKLLAMLGAWNGWQMLPAIILFSSLVGALVGLALILFFRHGRNTPIPFGPYLAAAGWLTLLWGNDMVDYYLRVSGLAP